MMRNSLIVIVFLALLTSCSNDDVEAKSDALEQQVTSIPVLCQPSKVASGIETDEDETMGEVIHKQFNEGDKLFFSQRTSTSSPNFTNPENESHPLYVYEYYKEAEEEEGATWDDGYNFKCPTVMKPFDWNKAASRGSVGNVFQFYAFHFPNNPNNNEIKFEVQSDQTNLDNFLNSDILGAYHATSSLHTRLRFRLFHLMVYLKVILYVPIYKGEEVTSGDNPQYRYSGFEKGAVQGAFVMNANTAFSISWTVPRSSDIEAPLIESSKDSKQNIKMYRHPSDESIIEINPKEYYTDQSLGPDEVRKYEFSVLFPSQTFGDNEKFLCFVLKAQENQMKYYYFSKPQLVGNGNDDTYSLTQGTLQQLELYLPRTTNETILIGANILPWKEAGTDMTLTEDKSASEGGTENNQTLQ